MSFDKTAALNRRILDLMASIENRKRCCFHEFDADLEQRCIDALDGKTSATAVINKLCKIIDEMEMD